jgi:hypothetical protein
MMISCLHQSHIHQRVTVVANAKSNANNAVSARVLVVAVIMTPIYLSIFSFSNGTMQPMELWLPRQRAQILFQNSRRVAQTLEQHQAFDFLVADFGKMVSVGSLATPVFLECLVNVRFVVPATFECQVRLALLLMVGRI